MYKIKLWRFSPMDNSVLVRVRDVIHLKIAANKKNINNVPESVSTTIHRSHIELQ